ncbi:MAG: glycoside hydrolase family 5 protein [Lachnospiraceae bacterium]|nr:glycoside hydrolase family 5 protein [Lachnospiraceae bacterium]
MKREIMEMKILKKLVVLMAVVGLIALGLSACGGTPSGPHQSKNGIETSDDGVMRKDLTALELAELMGNGINLGNTMEAYGHTTIGVGADVSAYETYWGCPVTTQEIVTGMKEAGFTALRVPVAWTNAMNYESGDYTIGEDYLNRVEEIINYALNEDMYVIINDHWDGGWWGMFGSANEETRAQAMELYTSMWTQIAERYKEYSDYLIFESANEELGYRLNDTDVAADSGTLSDAECFTVANQINQAFVDTVRATGGNNENRFLLIAGFGTDITNTCNSQFVMPTDTANSKLLISVHYYDPSGYCIFDSVPSWGNKDHYIDQNTMLAKMTQFTDQGYGVIIGEYGVLMENGTMKENTAEYYRNFLSNCDLYGYVPMLWDCSNMYDRRNCKIVDDEVASIFLEHSYAVQSKQSRENIQANAQAYMDQALEAAPEGAGVDENTAMAWIMYNSSDWNISYSVGDVYKPDDKTAGIEAVDVEVTGPGTYTVSLDFTGTSGGYANSVVFSALAISNAETLYPDCIINIKEVLINGEPYKLGGRPYTSSDDGKCTRVNLYNGWVSAVPDDARVFGGGGMAGVTPNLLDPDTLGNVETIEVTFEFITAE